MKRQVSMNSFLIGIKGEKSIENHQGNPKKNPLHKNGFIGGFLVVIRLPQASEHWTLYFVENWGYPHEFEIIENPVPFFGMIKGETNHLFVYQEKWDVYIYIYYTYIYIYYIFMSL